MSTHRDASLESSLVNSSVRTTSLAFSSAQLVGEGVGIHSGEHFSLSYLESSKEGLRFWAEQKDGLFEAPARYTRLSGTTRSTALVLRSESTRRIELRTVEHFLAAAQISGIWNADFILAARGEKTQDLFEVPVLDGAALNWWHKLAPIREKKEKSKFKAWLPLRSFEEIDGDKRLLICPWENSRTKVATLYHSEVSFAPSWNQQKSFEMDWLNPEKSWKIFESEIAPARTFGFLRELKMLEEKGLAKGGSLSNALVLDEDRIVNPEGFKVDDELAAHKLLDLIGDFSLLEGPVLGWVRAEKAGHALHLRALDRAVKAGALVQVTVDPSTGQIHR